MRVATLRVMDDQRWETEALRESQTRKGGRPAVSQRRRTAPSQTAMWVTLREASDATGIPVGTLGSWARRGTVESYLEGNGGRKLRIVDLNDVRSRASELGRPVAPVPVRRVEQTVSSPPSEAVLTPKTEQTDTMIVPIDAWNKMLNQLGNLHEAGQQLAEARERAAKAETEVDFLRDRLSELREVEAPPVSSPSGGGAEHSEAEEVKEVSRPRSDPETEPWMPEAADDPEPELDAAAVEDPPRRLWRTLYAGWKSRRR